MRNPWKVLNEEKTMCKAIEEPCDESEILKVSPQEIVQWKLEWKLKV